MDLLKGGAGGGNLVPGTTPIIGGIDRAILFDNAGVLGESSGLTLDINNKLSVIRTGGGAFLEGSSSTPGTAVFQFYVDGTAGFCGTLNNFPFAIFTNNNPLQAFLIDTNGETHFRNYLSSGLVTDFVSGSGTATIDIYSSSTAGYLGTHTNHPLSFYMNNNVSSPSLSIDTSSVSNFVKITGGGTVANFNGGAGTANAQIYSNGATALIGTSNNYPLGFYVNSGNNALTIDTNGASHFASYPSTGVVADFSANSGSSRAIVEIYSSTVTGSIGTNNNYPLAFYIASGSTNALLLDTNQTSTFTSLVGLVAKFQNAGGGGIGSNAQFSMFCDSSGGGLGTVNNFPLFFYANNGSPYNQMWIYPSGGMFIGSNPPADPGNGNIYTSATNFILRSKGTITGGATGNVPTLTAGPVTGNPTKWLPYDDNGTTRYIPAW